MTVTPLFGGCYVRSSRRPLHSTLVRAAAITFGTSAGDGARSLLDGELFITPVVYSPEKSFNKELIL